MRAVCRHVLCAKHRSSNGASFCYYVGMPQPSDMRTFNCECGVHTQGGVAGFLAHRRTVHEDSAPAPR